MGAERRNRWRTVVVAAAGVLVMLLLIGLLPHGLFSGDEGVKLIQTQSLLARDLAGDSLVYPGESIDPGHEHFPLFPPHALVARKRHYGIYSPLFALLSVPGWMAARYDGALVIPALAAVASALLLLALARRAGVAPWLGALAAGASLVLAPLAAYGATATEHTLAVAAALGMLLLAERGPPRWWTAALIGALLGGAAILRTEALVFAPAFCLYELLRRGWSRATVGRLAIVALASAVVFGAYAARCQIIFGAWNPAVLANQTANRRTSLLQGLPMLVPQGVGRVAGLPPWVLLAAAAVLGATCRVRGALQTVWQVLALVVAIAWCVVCVKGTLAVLGGQQRTLVGLFGATPVLLLGLMTLARAPRAIDGAAGIAAVLFAVLAFLTNVDRDAGGLQIGARHLLIAAPLLCLAATRFVERGALCKLTAALLLAVSLFAAVGQLVGLARVKAFHGDIASKAFAPGTRDVVTSFWWAPQALAEGYADHRIYFAPNGDLIRQFRRAGVTRFVQVLGGYSPEDIRREGMVVVDDSAAPTARVLELR